MQFSTIFFRIPDGNSTQLVEENLSDLTVIGQGSYATVFQKNMPTLTGFVSESKDLAIKTTFIEQPYIQERTREEIRILKNLQGLPNIPVFIGSFDLDEMITMTTNLIPGKTLYASMVVSEEYVPAFTVLSVTKQIASALDALRNKRIIHGDLTEKNIMFDGQRVTILDFGLATDLATTPSNDHIMYPMDHRPPEVFLSTIVHDNSPDVWCLGNTIYRVFTKHRIILGNSLESFDQYKIVIKQMTHILNPPPLDFLAKSEYSKFYFKKETNELIDTTPLNSIPRSFELVVDIAKQKKNEETSSGIFLRNLIEKMIRWDPKDRIAPNAILDEIHEYEKNLS